MALLYLFKRNWTMVAKEKILAELHKFAPAEIISGVVVNGAAVGFALESKDEALRDKCEKAVFALPGVEKVTAVLTGSTGNITVENKNTPALDRRAPVPGVKKVIAVAAGKGGVGKSTISVNLAIAAAASGKRVALVDADIYGPSIPLMMNLKGKPDFIDNKMIAPVSNGVYCNSIGLLIDEGSAAIWRGPMATKAIHQLLLGTAWTDIDIMFIDFPPGTGDIQLSLAQNYKIDGAIIVSTPQEVALADVRKASAMFTRVNIPVIGVIENMSYFADPSGNKHYIFGEGGAKKFATDIGAPLLGEIPIQPQLRENADKGTPQVSDLFKSLVAKLD